MCRLDIIIGQTSIITSASEIV